MSAGSTLTIDKATPGLWRVRLDNPPINAIDAGMYDELYDLVEAMESDAALKVVTFESANPDYFIAHYVQTKERSRHGTPPWIETSMRLARSSVLSIAIIRGRVRGGGCEFVLACDIRFASRERAVFGQPEVGAGIIPGGGALERLPLQVGRSRSLEIVLGADDYDAETAERYGWINRAIPEAELDTFVGNYVRRILSFEKEPLAVAKATINRHTLPDETDLRATQDTFAKSYGWPGASERFTKLGAMGLGKASDLELNLGREVGNL